MTDYERVMDKIEEHMPERAHELAGDYQLEEPSMSEKLETEHEMLETNQDYDLAAKTAIDLLEQCYSQDTGEWNVDYIERLTDKVNRDRAVELFEDHYGRNENATRTFSTVFEDKNPSNPLVPENMGKKAT